MGRSAINHIKDYFTNGENIDNETSRYQYDSKDLAIIIPTKDRPKEVKRLLKSICELDCRVGRIIVVASGRIYIVQLWLILKN